MANVKKRNGSTQQYDVEKVKSSIKKALTDAGENIEDKKEWIEKTAKDITDEMQEKGEKTTQEIKKKALNALDEAESKAAEAWRKFDKKYKPLKK